jgi:hypothetical protein
MRRRTRENVEENEEKRENEEKKEREWGREGDKLQGEKESE